MENAELESEINADAAKQDAESDDRATAAWGRARLRALGRDRLSQPMSASMIGMAALVGVLLLLVVALVLPAVETAPGRRYRRDPAGFPCVGGHGWRHGVMRYRGGEAGFYRLSSMRWWPDRRLSRRGIEVVVPSRAPRRRVRHHDRRNRRAELRDTEPGSARATRSHSTGER